MDKGKPIVLETGYEIIAFDPNNASLISFRSKAAPEQEFIEPRAERLAFVIGYYDEQRQYRLLTSDQAGKVEVSCVSEGQGQVLKATYEGIGGKDLGVAFTVRAAGNDRYSRWN